jgi:hypothetical protein
MSGNFVVYLIGYIIAIIGVAYGLSAAGLAQEWIIAVVLIMAGLGIVYALSRSQRDAATNEQRSSATSPGASAPTAAHTSTDGDSPHETSRRRP